MVAQMGVGLREVEVQRGLLTAETAHCAVVLLQPPPVEDKECLNNLLALLQALTICCPNCHHVDRRKELIIDLPRKRCNSQSTHKAALVLHSKHAELNRGVHHKQSNTGSAKADPKQVLKKG